MTVNDDAYAALVKQFAFGAHQVKSPISSIVSLLNAVIFSYQDQLPDKVKKMLLSALDKSDDLYSLISDLLEMGNLTERDRDAAPVQLEKLMADLQMKLDRLVNERKIRFSVISPRLMPSVMVDQTMVYNIIYNLAENAITYTPSGGEVTVTVDYDQQREIFDLVVSDTGIGIPEEYQPNIFDEFFRAPNARIEKNFGTGLGLSIVRRSIDALHGSIRVESAPGAGTRFYVQLPIRMTSPDRSRSRARRKRVVIIGGGAGGPKVAAKLRRLKKDIELVLVEKEEFLSYSGCGIPHYISGVVADKRDLMSSGFGELRNPDFFKRIGDIEVSNYTEAVMIDRERKTVQVNSFYEKGIREIAYDTLVIATGGIPIIPDIDGIEKKNIFSLRSITDADRLKEVLSSPRAKDAVIVGGGLIGMEIAESLLIKGSRVSVIERESCVLPMFDPDVSLLIQNRIERHGIKFFTEEQVLKFSGEQAVDGVITDHRTLPADFVIISTGIRPNVDLAKKSGIKLGQTGAISVNACMQTSDPSIYAVGDCVENIDMVTGKKIYMPLGTIANKHGRVAALHIANKKARFRGITGTVVFKVFNISVGKTGLSSHEALAAGYDPVSVLVPSLDREHYINDSELVITKLIGDRKNEKLLGVQIFGNGDVVRRIDIAASALFKGMKIGELSELDIAYLPAFGLPFDPIIVAAHVWRNFKQGIYDKINSNDLYAIRADEDIYILDVRTPAEFSSYSIPRAINIPLGSVRAHIQSIPKEKNIVLVCDTGMRSYAASLILRNFGFDRVSILDGGLTCWPYV